jgi:methyl-accepting chemotaxis protein
MKKYTKRFKKNKNNRTVKKGGGNEKEREGIFDMIGNKISGVASYVGNKITDDGLRIIGLKRINDTPQEVSTQKVDENVEKITDAASGVVSGVGTALDKTGSTALNSVNDVLGSDTAKDMTKEAAEETANIIKEGAEIFNDTLDKPEVKEEVKEALEKAGEIGEIIVKASEKPIDKLVDVASKETPKIIGATSAGLVKVGTDMLGAVPFVGGIIDLGKAVNDGSKAISASVEAGSEVVEASADAIKETTKNIENELKDLEEKQQVSQEISNRTTDSINTFENPLNKPPPQKGGNRKTKRKLIKRRLKSKRVRFAI